MSSGAPARTEPPAGHGEGLGKTADDDGALLHAVDFRNGNVLLAAVCKFAIDFVGDDDDIRPAQHCRNPLQILTPHDRAGRVIGIGQNEQLRLWGDGGLQRLRRQAKLILCLVTIGTGTPSLIVVSGA